MMTEKALSLTQEEVFEAWKELPGAYEGLSIVSVMRLVRERPQDCSKMIYLINKCSKVQRNRAIERHIRRIAMDWEGASGWKEVTIEYRVEYRKRRQRKGVKNRRRTRSSLRPLSHPQTVYIIHKRPEATFSPSGQTPSSIISRW